MGDPTEAITLVCPVCGAATPLVGLTRDDRGNRYVPCRGCGTRLYIDEAGPPPA